MDKNAIHLISIRYDKLNVISQETSNSCGITLAGRQQYILLQFALLRAEVSTIEFNYVKN